MSPFLWTAALLMASMVPAGNVDDWPWPEPTSYHSVGFANAVVIYDADGELVRALSLDSLIPEGDVDRFEHSESSRWWNEGARYYVTRDRPRLFVVLSWGAAMEFGLEDGRYVYGAADDFPDLSALLSASFANEEAEVWATSLRFSSITDVLQARP